MPSPASPKDTSDQLASRIAARARQMWEADGKPKGQQAEFEERARELIGMEDNPGAGQLPNPMAEGGATDALPGQTGSDLLPKPAGAVIEEADIQENLGEFPGALTDQGDRQQVPSRSRKNPS